MLSPLHGFRKRRTRQHVIADLSVHHVEGLILEEGHTAQRMSSDYGYDLTMWTFDESGYAETDSVRFQIKASDSPKMAGNVYVFDLDIRDYNLWIWDKSPVILVLYDAKERRAYWQHVQKYFREQSHWPKPGAKTVRVRIPRTQKLNRRAIEIIRGLKRKGDMTIWGELP